MGETKNIAVTIANSSEVFGVEFEIHYESSIVEPVMGNVSWGNIFQGFKQVNLISNGVIKVATASDSAFTGDGTIITIPFTLKKGGVASLKLEKLKVFNDEGTQLHSSGSNGAINVTVVKTPLPQVGKPTWNGDTINWGGVANAASYRVKLYKNGSLVETVEPSGTTYDFASFMGGAGRYTVTVQALAGSSDTYSDGPVSAASSERVKTEPLARVGKPTWDGNRSSGRCGERRHLPGDLYKDGQSHSVTVNGTAYNFSERINQGTGSYTVTGSAARFIRTYTEGEVSFRPRK